MKKRKKSLTPAVSGFPPPLSRGAAGFTLIEMMVVVAILGLLITIVGVNLIGNVDKARATKAMAQIKNFEAALDLYQLDNAVYPITEQGLKALVEKPSVGETPCCWREGGYLRNTNQVPLDPWNHEYVYLAPGTKGPYDIISYGADGRPAGDGKNADITNWDTTTK